MSTPQADPLDWIAALVQQAQEGAGRAFLLLQRFPIATTEEARRDLALGAKEQAKNALDATGMALEALQGAGARLPDRKGSRPRPEPNPLAEMARAERSRPEALALLDALRTAFASAEALDLARGRSLEAPIAGSAGCDLAEDLAQLIARLELELYGPAQSVTGGRE